MRSNHLFLIAFLSFLSFSSAVNVFLTKKDLAPSSLAVAKLLKAASGDLPEGLKSELKKYADTTQEKTRALFTDRNEGQPWDPSLVDHVRKWLAKVADVPENLLRDSAAFRDLAGPFLSIIAKVEDGPLLILPHLLPELQTTREATMDIGAILGQLNEILDLFKEGRLSESKEWIHGVLRKLAKAVRGQIPKKLFSHLKEYHKEIKKEKASRLSRLGLGTALPSAGEEIAEMPWDSKLIYYLQAWLAGIPNAPTFVQDGIEFPRVAQKFLRTLFKHVLVRTSAREPATASHTHVKSLTEVLDQPTADPTKVEGHVNAHQHFLALLLEVAAGEVPKDLQNVLRKYEADGEKQDEKRSYPVSIKMLPEAHAPFLEDLSGWLVRTAKTRIVIVNPKTLKAALKPLVDALVRVETLALDESVVSPQTHTVHDWGTETLDKLHALETELSLLPPLLTVLVEPAFAESPAWRSHVLKTLAEVRLGAVLPRPLRSYTLAQPTVLDPANGAFPSSTPATSVASYPPNARLMNTLLTWLQKRDDAPKILATSVRSQQLQLLGSVARILFPAAPVGSPAVPSTSLPLPPAQDPQKVKKWSEAALKGLLKAFEGPSDSAELSVLVEKFRSEALDNPSGCTVNEPCISIWNRLLVEAVRQWFRKLPGPLPEIVLYAAPFAHYSRDFMKVITPSLNLPVHSYSALENMPIFEDIVSFENGVKPVLETLSLVSLDDKMREIQDIFDPATNALKNFVLDYQALNFLLPNTPSCGEGTSSADTATATTSRSILAQPLGIELKCFCTKWMAFKALVKLEKTMVDLDWYAQREYDRFVQAYSKSFGPKDRAKQWASLNFKVKSEVFDEPLRSGLRILKANTIEGIALAIEAKNKFTWDLNMEANHWISQTATRMKKKYKAQVVSPAKEHLQHCIKARVLLTSLGAITDILKQRDVDRNIEFQPDQGDTENTPSTFSRFTRWPFTRNNNKVQETLGGKNRKNRRGMGCNAKEKGCFVLGCLGAGALHKLFS